MDKIMPFPEFATLRQSINKKIVLAGGCFDVFHYGHLVYLKKAKEQGDVLIVLLEADETIRLKRNQKPVHSQQERAEILAVNQDVDYVVLLDILKTDDEYEKLVKVIKPSVIAVTEGDPQIENKTNQAKSVGGKLVVVTPLIKKLSSSKIKNHAAFSGN